MLAYYCNKESQESFHFYLAHKNSGHRFVFDNSGLKTQNSEDSWLLHRKISGCASILGINCSKSKHPWDEGGGNVFCVLWPVLKIVIRNQDLEPKTFSFLKPICHKVKFLLTS